jgi:glycosyltransferase involved in cell wall biosynthesis
MTQKIKNSKRIPLTIIIPARNEESVILKTLESLKKDVKVPYKIIVINDSSVDKTRSLVVKYSKKNKNLSVIDTTPDKNGFSEAIKLGLSKIKGGLVIPVMADFCDDPRAINLMYKKMVEEGWDVVCGSRYIKGGRKTGSPKLQGALSYLVCKIVKIFIGVNTSDATNSFKMYRKKILDKISITLGRGAEVSLEIILKSHFLGAKIVDIPTTWKGRPANKSKFKLISRLSRYLSVVLWGFGKKYGKLLVFLILALMIILTYGQTLRMFFWVDDWGLVYKMIFPENSCPKV